MKRVPVNEMGQMGSVAKVKYQSPVIRVFSMLRSHGVAQTAWVLGSVLEDHYLKLFDRCYGVTTSGYIPLEKTSVSSAGTTNLHRYRGVNAWAFKSMLKTMCPEKSKTFVDLGSGLGRACILAAQYGFSRVTGVELVPEFCSIARRNLEHLRGKQKNMGKVQIANINAIEYTATATDDIYFLFRPFSGDVLMSVLKNIRAGARQTGSRAIIYSERVLQTHSDYPEIERYLGVKADMSLERWGQRFWRFTF